MALAVSVLALAYNEAAGRPSPSVDITLTGMDVGSFVTVLQIVEGKSQPVRGVTKQTILGTTMEFTDYEAPFGVPITYQAMVYSINGGIVANAQALPVVLDVTDCWISDPLVPAIAARVTLSFRGLAERSYAASGQVYSVEGHNTPVGVFGMRNVASDVVARFIVYTEMQNVAVQQVLNSASPFLVRAPIRARFVPLAYCVAPVVTTEQVDRALGGETSWITLKMTQVKPPTASIVVPVRTYDDLLAEATTYGDLATIYSSYLRVLRG